MPLKIKLIFISLVLFIFGTSLLALQEKRDIKSDFNFFWPQKPSENSISLIVWGDIMLSRGIWRWAKREGYDRTFANSGFNPLTQFPSYNSGQALVFFNLESPFSPTDNDKAQGGFLFRANSGNIQILKDIRANNTLLLSLANNHTNNAGGLGIQFTKETLKRANIPNFWAGMDKDEAQTLLKVKKNWLNLCFQAYSYDGSFYAHNKIPFARNPLNQEQILSDLERMQKLNCDFKILSLHRGAEYKIKANARQKQLAHQLIDQGADLIIWNHSHIPGEREIYKDKVIFYSLGNFLFDQDRGKNASGKTFDYIRDFDKKRLTVPTYIPLLAELKLTKTATWIHSSLPNFKSAEIKKWQFIPLNPQTLSGILEKISPKNISQ